MLSVVVVSSAALIAMGFVALGMVLTPGPNMVYLVSRSISQGRTAGLVSLAGTGLGFVVYMSMANLGLAAIFLIVPWLYVALKAVGVIYLGYLTWQTLRPGGHSLFEARRLERDSRLKLFRMGLVTNLLNPKAAVMYLALIPQFIDPVRGSATEQGFILGTVQIAISLTVNAVIVLLAGSIAAALTRRPRWAAWQRRVTGSLLGLVTLTLAVEVPQRAGV